MLADSSSGRITSDASLLPLRVFDQHHGLRRDLAQLRSDPPEDDHVGHDPGRFCETGKSVAGYEDGNNAPACGPDPMWQIVADQKLGEALVNQPTLHTQGSYLAGK